MGSKSKRKGRAGEQEAARLLTDLFGETVKRRLEGSREGGWDLIGLDGWAIEIKRAAKPMIPLWLKQAVNQANGQKPALLYRLDRRGWRAVVAMSDIVLSDLQKVL